MHIGSIRYRWIMDYRYVRLYTAMLLADYRRQFSTVILYALSFSLQCQPFFSVPLFTSLVRNPVSIEERFNPDESTWTSARKRGRVKSPSPYLERFVFLSFILVLCLKHSLTRERERERERETLCSFMDELCMVCISQILACVALLRLRLHNFVYYVVTLILLNHVLSAKSYFRALKPE